MVNKRRLPREILVPKSNYSGLNFNNIFQEVIKEEVGLDE
jgi:hypothetical protein